MDICIDFDGTCVSHEFPKIGYDIGAVSVLQEIISNGHRLILFTMRSDRPNGNFLTDAVNWFKENDIPLYGIQKNPTQVNWTTSPKAYADKYIDDSAVGCPLIKLDEEERPFVNWYEMKKLLIGEGIL